MPSDVFHISFTIGIYIIFNLKDLLDKSLKSTNKVPKQETDDKIGVLVMACNRPTVSFHLDQLLKFVLWFKNASS